MTPTPHYCPTHGKVVEAPPGALVTCGKCGADCAPEGVDPKEHRRRYFDRSRQAKARR